MENLFGPALFVLPWAVPTLILGGTYLLLVWGLQERLVGQRAVGVGLLTAEHGDVVYWGATYTGGRQRQCCR